MIVIILLTLIFLTLGALEYRLHQRNLSSIPIRVHINGTRGKSSVTRLVAATLRAGGYRTFAKVTGTLPRIIDYQGLEVPILRLHGANILEQVKIVRYMARRKPQAMVMECMAVIPEYQWICEHRMVKATIGVITNSRPDHLREMGPTLENITHSLMNTIPDHGVAFTAERKMFALMKKEADKRGIQLIQVREDEVPEAAMRRFDHLEHRENVAIALGIAKLLKIPQEKALEGMYASYPDPGALRLYTACEEGKEIRFANALAANDPESTLTIWQKVLSIYPDPGDVMVMLNTRADRFDRSLQLLEMIGDNVKYDYLISIGEKTKMLAQYYQRYKIDSARVVELGLTSKEHIYQKVFQLVSRRATILAIGNMGAGGLDVAYYFRDQGKHHKEKTSD